jgi:hypothetical protein
MVHAAFAGELSKISSLSQVFEKFLDHFLQTRYGLFVPARDERRAERHGAEPIRKVKMIRNLKTLGLALVAVFAMSALAASAASAQQGKLTSDGPVTLDASIMPPVEGGDTNALTAFGGTRVECNGVRYTGHKYNVTPHALIENGATQVTITPHYHFNNATCNTEAFGFTFPTTIDMNGCDYEFDLGGTSPPGAINNWDVGATVRCPAGADITLTVYTPGSNHLKVSEAWCGTRVTEKAPPFQYTGLKASNLAGGKVRITGTIKGIEVHKEDLAHANGLFPCPVQTDPAAELHIDVKVEGTVNGAPTPISISD